MRRPWCACLLLSASIFSPFFILGSYAAEATDPPASGTDARVVGPSLSASDFLDETSDDIAAPFSEGAAPSDAPGERTLTPSQRPRLSKASPEDLKKAAKEDKGTILPGGRVKMSGRYRLALGVDTEDVIVNDANGDLFERNFRYLYGEALNNTFDQAIYQKYLLNIDFSPHDKVNFYTQLVADPWSWVGSTGEQTTTSTINPALFVKYNLKYFGAMNSTLNEVYRTHITDSIGFPMIKVHDGHISATHVEGFDAYDGVDGNGKGLPYDIPEHDIYYEFKPIRKLWVDYTEDEWHARVFALADQEQALTTDDPLELSNHKDFWQWSPWLETYKPVQFFSDHSIKRGYYSNYLPYIAKDSEGNRLVLLRGAAYEADFGKTYVSATVASPIDPWSDYTDVDNIPGAIRLKQQVTDAWMVGGVYTFRSGLIDNSVADFGQVGAVDTKYQINDNVAVKGEIASSHREIDLLTDENIQTDSDGNAYKVALEADFDHKMDGHTNFLFSYTQMDQRFEPMLSRYYSTRNDKFWGKHLTFREYDPGLDYFRLGDGVDADRFVFRINWKEKLFREKFENLFDVRNVHKTHNAAYVETVIREEMTYHFNSRWTGKGLFRWHGLPKTTPYVDPFLSTFYYDSNLVDQSQPNIVLQNVDISADQDASRFTYSGGLQYIVSKELTLEGIVERSNDVSDFPRGLMGDVFRTNVDRVDGILIDRLQPFLYHQRELQAVAPYPYHTIVKERVAYTPINNLTYTLHATQNTYRFAGGIDDNINHFGLSMELDYTKRLSFFADWTYSHQIDLPRFISSNYADRIYSGHQNVYASMAYKITPSQIFRAEYGVLGFGLDTPYQPLTTPYSGVSFALPTIDTEHLFRVSLEGEF